MSAKPVHPVSIVEAKARFSEVVREAEAGGIVVIRRHGRDGVRRARLGRS